MSTRFQEQQIKKDFWQVDGSEVDMKGICIWMNYYFLLVSAVWLIGLYYVVMIEKKRSSVGWSEAKKTKTIYW